MPAPSPRTLRLLEDRLAVCRLPGEAAVPDWVRPMVGFVSTTRAAGELSIVCAAARVPADRPADLRAEVGWRALRLAGPLDLSLVGVLAALLQPVAAAGIPILAVSTFDTDYVLVRERTLDAAVEALTAAGYVVLVDS